MNASEVSLESLTELAKLNGGYHFDAVGALAQAELDRRAEKPASVEPPVTEPPEWYNIRTVLRRIIERLEMDKVDLPDAEYHRGYNDGLDMSITEINCEVEQLPFRCHERCNNHVTCAASGYDKPCKSFQEKPLIQKPASVEPLPPYGDYNYDADIYDDLERHRKAINALIADVAELRKAVKP